jgi:Uncharacterized component of anaerobic dehydrogenases
MYVQENRKLEFGDLLPLLKLRVLTYDFLRRTFISEPAHELLDMISNGLEVNEFPFAVENQSLCDGVSLVKQYLVDYSRNHDHDKVLERLNWEYTRLFIGPHELAAPPWESAYLNEERLLFQKETLAVRRAYLKYAFIVHNYGHVADDHLGLELDFMFHLSLETLKCAKLHDIAALTRVLVEQKEFMAKHLQKWVPSWCHDISKLAETDFYRGMAKILEGFLILDQSALVEIMQFTG